MSEQTEETILQVDGEQRNCEVSEIRAVGNGPLPRLVGYAAKFNIVSQDFGAGFREKILPGAFAPALAVDREVLAIVGHDFNQPLGRRSAGTLKLREDNVGLYFEIDPPDTAIGRDAVENVRRGDIKGASFRFNNAKDSWGRNADGDRVRTISSFGILREISLTTIPAHESTEVAVGTLPTFKRESEPTNDDRQQQLESQEQLLAAGAEEVRRDRLRDAEQKLRSDIGYDAIDAEADEADFQERRQADDCFRQWVTINGAHIDIGNDADPSDSAKKGIEAAVDRHVDKVGVEHAKNVIDNEKKFVKADVQKAAKGLKDDPNHPYWQTVARQSASRMGALNHASAYLDGKTNNRQQQSLRATPEQREQGLREREAKIDHSTFVPPGMVVHYTLDHQRFLIPKRGRMSTLRPNGGAAIRMACVLCANEGVAYGVGVGKSLKKSIASTVTLSHAPFIVPGSTRIFEV